MFRVVLSFFAVLLLYALPARAEVQTYGFDKVHTQVLFFADHLGYSKSQGEFHTFDGGFVFDTAHPESSSIDVTVHTDSLDMNDERWDNHLKGADFFNVEKFPTMHFKSTAIAVTGENTADITGDLTLLGVTKPVVLHVTHNKSGMHPMTNRHIAGFSATAEIDRSEWGMTYGLPMMSPTVEIRLEVEGERSDEADAHNP